jgi:N-acetylated-alpha-linked acidic dipeptidase
MKLVALTAVLVVGVQACQREFFARNGHHRHSLRRRDTSNTTRPALDANEATLLQSFDSVSISDWSYYYTHGLHVAGTNKSMAQWTADRWNEFGFTAGLAEYCRLLSDARTA